MLEKGHMNSLLINSIYFATEGEGVHIGTPQVFVRFQGCRVGCLNCDSLDTWSFNGGEFFELQEVMTKIVECGGDQLKRVSITGGDPLHPKNLPAVILLSKELKKKGYYINLEASGTRIIHELFDLIDFISFDYKTPSTGVKTSMNLIEELISQYQGKFQIKSVIETKEDFFDVLSSFHSLDPKITKQFSWVLTPAYNLNHEFPKDRFIETMNMNKDHGGHFRVIGQQHKWIFGPNQKEV